MKSVFVRWNKKPQKRKYRVFIERSSFKPLVSRKNGKAVVFKDYRRARDFMNKIKKGKRRAYIKKI